MQPSNVPQKAAGPSAKPRRKRCLNCLNLFIPDPRLNTPARIAKGCEPKYCSENCRKEWHRNGGVSFARQKAIIEQMVRREIEPFRKAVKAQLAAALATIRPALDHGQLPARGESA